MTVHAVNLHAPAEFVDQKTGILTTYGYQTLRLLLGPASGIFGILNTDPSPATNDTFWVVKEGISPAQMITLKVRIGGTTYPVASVGPI